MGRIERTHEQESEIIAEAVYRDSYIVEDWIYYLPGLKTIYLNYE